MFSPERWAALVRWRGVVLAGVAIVVTLSLAFSGQLLLYISPGYLIFTIVMAVIGLVLLGASFAVRAAHGHEDAPPGRAGAVASVAGGAVTLVLAAAMLVVPPAVLSSATALQRGVGTTTANSSSTPPAAASAATYAKFTVEDWSALLSQTSDAAFYAGKPVDVSGFVTAHSATTFYLTRFVITCCAVDAQPVDVPVYLPGWQKRFAANQWLEVRGGFASPSVATKAAGVQLVPSAVRTITAPTDPYLY